MLNKFMILSAWEIEGLINVCDKVQTFSVWVGSLKKKNRIRHASGERNGIPLYVKKYVEHVVSSIT